jgi:hypothetical protein
MPHVGEERSQSLLFDDPPDTDSIAKDLCLKRKRGFYPCTEEGEDDGSCLSSTNESLCLPPSSIMRPFEDSVPWYQWKRKSFAMPEERVKKFTVPNPDTESEDEFWNAPEPRMTKLDIDLLPAPNEIHYREISFENTDVCHNCNGIKKSTVIETAKRYKSTAPLSRVETTLLVGLNCFFACADKLTNEYRAMKRGMPISKRFLTYSH